MRLLRFLFFYVPLAGCGVVLSLFLAQNWRPVRLDLFGPQYSISLAWVLVGAMAFGAFVAAVFLLPGRLAATMRAWSLERELRRWEQDLWRLQERRERLLIQHERLMEAHEHMLLTHQDLVEEHSLVLTERDEALARVDAVRALPAHQPARQPIPLARVAGASSTSPAPLPLDSPDSPASVLAIAAPDEPRPHGVRGGSGSASLPRWATPSPAARPATSIVSEASRDNAAREASEPATSAHPSVAVEQPPAHVKPEAAPARTRPPADSTPPLSSPSSSAHATLRSSASQISFLALLRSRLRTEIAESAAALADLRAALNARLAHLRRALPPGRAPIAPSSGTPDAPGTPDDPPGGDDRG